MIVSASYRTDIPAFFADWFRARLAAGAVEVANPYGGKPFRVALRGDGVDGYVFWTRNAAPFADAFDDVAALSLPFVVQYTITGYPRALDAHTPRREDAIAQVAALAARFGARAVVWRYDPVVITSVTDAGWHRRNFADIARKLAGSVDECVVSAAHIYKKTERRLNIAAGTHEFTWEDPDWDRKRGLLGELSEIAADNGIGTAVCSQPDVLSATLGAAACIDAARLSDVAGYEITARRKGNRDGCLCAESRDIGAYDTCAHGCAYCYAVSDHGRAVQKLRGLTAAPERSSP
tara:strand:- start:4137 stop:5012 length:876 start_codon:yes stop_codon:yes gene_type:complete